MKPLIVFREGKLYYAYATQAEVKKAGFSEDEGWSYVADIPIDETAYFIDDLKGGESYFVKLGVQTEKGISWSSVQEGETAKPWGLFNFLTLIGALAMFLFGMKIMSDGLQRMAGKTSETYLGTFTSNPLKVY